MGLLSKSLSYDITVTPHQLHGRKIKGTHYCPFVKGTHRSPVDSPHRGLEMWRSFQCHDVIMDTDPLSLEVTAGNFLLSRLNFALLILLIIPLSLATKALRNILSKLNNKKVLRA